MAELWETPSKYAYPMEGVARFNSDEYRYHVQYGERRGRIALTSKRSGKRWYAVVASPECRV